MRWFLKSLCWIFCCCLQNMYWKRCKNMDWNSVLLVLVTFVSFIVRVSSEGQNHTTVQWAYIVDSKQRNYTLVKYCVTVIPTDKPKWSFEIWWPCASLGCKGHSFRLWFSLPSSPISPSFICLSLIHPSLFVISPLSWIWLSSHCSVSHRFLPSLKSLERSLLNQRHPCSTSACTSLCLFKSFRFLERKSQQGFYRLCLICGWPYASPEAMTHTVYREKKGKG